MLLQSPLYKVVEIRNPKITLVKKTGVKVGDLVQIYTDTHKDKTYEGQQRFYFINRTTGFTIACSTLRLANDWCIEHQADEDYWRAQGDETVTNRCIITLNDGTDIVLRTASVDITGEDPVEEEMVMSWDGSLHRGFKEIGYKLKSEEVK